MKHLFVISAFCLSLTALGAKPAPKIDSSSVVIAQDPATRELVVSYTLADADAIVTVELLTNGVPVATSELAGMTGNPFERQSPGFHVLRWKPWESSLKGQTFGPNEVSVRLMAYSVDTPPDYLVVDLVAQHPDRPKYYPSCQTVPGGVSSNVYKTTKILMRRITAAGQECSLGAPPWERGYNTNPKSKQDGSRTGNVERVRLVVFTNDFYMAVYPFTQAQYELVAGSNPSEFTLASTGDQTQLMAPVENVSFYDINGKNRRDAEQEIGDGSLLAVLRSRTGFKFDLPSSAQWEYACRAGTGTALNNGHDLSETSGGTDPIMNEVGWYVNNSGSRTHAVGLKQPNAWGLYDMHGNVFEWCLDALDRLNWVPDTPGSIAVPAFGESHAKELRGGSWNVARTYCRSAYRYASVENTDKSNDIGFRVVCPVKE